MAVLHTNRTEPFILIDSQGEYMKKLLFSIVFATLMIACSDDGGTNPNSSDNYTGFVVEGKINYGHMACMTIKTNCKNFDDNNCMMHPENSVEEDNAGEIECKANYSSCSIHAVGTIFSSTNCSPGRDDDGQYIGCYKIPVNQGTIDIQFYEDSFQMLNATLGTAVVCGYL